METDPDADLWIRDIDFPGLLNKKGKEIFPRAFYMGYCEKVLQYR